MTDPDAYLLGRSRAEEERLRKQVADLAVEARWLLDQLDIPVGARALELGCGPQGVLDLLSERVGPRGSVVGLERSGHFAASARQFVADRRLGNVEVVEGDAKATNLPRGSFDVVFSRFVLVNVPEPERVVDEMVALLRPGGVVASHEADYLPHVCDPPSHAWDRLMEIFRAHCRAIGVDPFVGRRTHRMLRVAGIVDVQVRPVIHVYPHGHHRRTILLDFIRDIRDAAIRGGVVGERELDELVDELQHHLDDPDTLVVSHLYFQVWGRKPAP
jgi:SAM-dependent methyltransferase